jgi:peptide/nickel transport system ATP-binding protein
VIVVENLNITARNSGLAIVKDIAFSVEPGKVMGLVGESGSGKTTVSLALLAYAKPGTLISRGSRVLIGGVDILSLPLDEQRKIRGKLVSYVPQDPSASLNPAIRIGVQLVEGLLAGEDALSKEAADERVAKLLGEVGLPSTEQFLNRYPAQLSGGQLQRVAIAMAVASHPRLIVLDEPTTGLDVATQNEVLAMMSRVCSSHDIAAIYISHDLAVVGHVADTIVVLYAGRIVENGLKEQILSCPSHPYTRALLAAMPSVSEARLPMPIHGKTPPLADRDEGCVFRSRCRFAEEMCAVPPAIVPVAEFHDVRCHFTRKVRSEPLDRAPFIVSRPSYASTVMKVAGLNARYGDTTILHDVSFSLEKGECLAVVGESGSGKTTLSRCLIGLHHNWHGRLDFEGTALASSSAARTVLQRRRIQYIFQNPYGSLNPRKTVAANLAVPIRHFATGDASDINRSIQDVLQRVELRPDHAARYPNELSGGEKQRVAIARALLCSPEILICDEITSALDVSVQAAILALLRSLMDDGLSIVFVTHNLGVVRSLAHRVAVLDKGRVVELGDTSSVMSEPSADYTRILLANTLELA